jgi:cytoskeletal protein CcmA (bactofilin family)
MRRVWLSVVAVIALLVLLSQTVVAAPLNQPLVQGTEGIHFGSYELQPGARVSGDLVVFGGPVVIREDSEFDGDLTVFGPMTLERDALVDGQLVVLGAADIGGQVHGNVFTAGEITLRATAYIEGDLSATGAIRQSPGAVVVGEIQSVDQQEWDRVRSVPLPFIGPGVVRPPQINQTPRWVTFIWRIVQGLVTVVLLGLLALVIASLWPAQTERVGRVIEEEPLTTYGTGLLTLILSGIAAVLLTITICLSPFAAIGMVIVALGLLVGWVALGMVLGRRLLVGALNTPNPTPVASAVLGTVLISLILALSRVLGPIHALLLFLLAPLSVGAVLLTRFGTRPYATRGVPQPPDPRCPIAPPPTGTERPLTPSYDAPDRPADTGVLGGVEPDSGVRIYEGGSDADSFWETEVDEDR